MFGKSFRWDYDYKDPEEWIDWMSGDTIDCDHYFMELTAEYLNRRILIYPLFETEVWVQIIAYIIAVYEGKFFC